MYHVVKIFRSVVGNPLLPIMVLATLLRLSFSVGLQYTDSALYAESAYNLSAGNWFVPDSAYSIRYGFVLPIALSIKLLGISDFALSLYPLASSLIIIALAYDIGIRLSGRSVGLVAALLLATLPLNVFQATDLHADLPMSMWLALTFWLFLRGANGAQRAQSWCFGLAGLAFGLAYLTKLTTVVFIPALVALAVYNRPLKRSGWALIVLAVIFALESASYYLVTGDVHHRIHAEMAAGEHAREVGMVYPDRLHNIWLAFSEIPKLILIPYPVSGQTDFGYHFILLPVAFIWIIRRPDRPVQLLIWFVLLYLALSFATLDFDTFAPAQLRVPRVLEPLCLPSMLLVAMFLVSVLRFTALCLTILLITLPSLFFSFQLHFDARQDIGPLEEVYSSYLSARPDDSVVFADPWTVKCLNCLDRYRHPSRFQEYPADRATGYVLINRSVLPRIARWLGYSFPSWVLSHQNAELAASVYPEEQIRGGFRDRLSKGESLLRSIWSTRPVTSGAVELWIFTPK